jgi:hypothetical protein
MSFIELCICSIFYWFGSICTGMGYCARKCLVVYPRQPLSDKYSTAWKVRQEANLRLINILSNLQAAGELSPAVHRLGL